MRREATWQQLLAEHRRDPRTTTAQPHRLESDTCADVGSSDKSFLVVAYPVKLRTALPPTNVWGHPNNSEIRSYAERSGIWTPGRKDRGSWN